jgi:hypothetical protein
VGTFQNHVDDPAMVSEVVDILKMWHFIESAYEKTSRKGRVHEGAFSLAPRERSTLTTSSCGA